MKKTLTLLSTLLITTSVFAQSLTGYDIMKKCSENPEPKTSSITATLTVHSKKGNDHIRELIMISKEHEDVTKQVIAFTAPKDIAGTGYLMFDYNDEAKDSDNWLYMPAMKKARRIVSSGSEGDGSFMGTDLTFDDMGNRNLDNDDYTLIGDDSVDGVDCYKIEAVSKNHTKKDPRRTVYIGKEDFLMYKAEFYDRQNTLHRVLTCRDFTTIDGYKSAKTMKMENVQSGSWSLIQMKDVVYNDSNIDDSLFTVAALENGRVR